MPNGTTLYLPPVNYQAAGALNTGTNESTCCGNGAVNPFSESTKTQDYGPTFGFGGDQVSFKFTTSIPQIPTTGDCNRVLTVGCTNATACILTVTNPDGSVYNVPLSTQSSGQPYPAAPSRTGVSWWIPTNQRIPGTTGFYQESGVTHFTVTFTLADNSNSHFTSSASDPGSWAFIQGQKWGMAVPFNAYDGSLKPGEKARIAQMNEPAGGGTVNGSGQVCITCIAGMLFYTLYNYILGPASMGYGWSMGAVNARVVIEPDSADMSQTPTQYLDFYDGSGSFDRWTINGDGSFTPLYANLYTTAVKNGDGTYTLTFQDRNKMTFYALDGSASQGKAHTLVDPNGNTTTYSYNVDGSVASVVDGEGRGQYFDYTGRTDKQPVHVYQRDPSVNSDPNVSRPTTFAYAPSGSQLTSITDPANNVTAMTYTGGQIYQIFDPRHSAAKDLAAVTYTYYDNTSPYVGLVKTEQQYDQRLMTYTYNTNADNSGTISILDQDLLNSGNNRTTLNTYDIRRRLINSVDQLGNQWNYEYQDTLSPYLLTLVVDPNLNVTAYNYNNRGNPTSTTDAKGNTTTFTYDPTFIDQISTIQPPSVQVWVNGVLTPRTYNPTKFSYDSTSNTGNLLSIQDSLSQLIQYSYAGRTDGRVYSITDRNSNVTLFQYTDKNVDTNTNTGNLKSILFPGGSSMAQMNFGYDLYDNCTSVSDTVNTVGIQYDNLNRPTQKTNPLTDYTVWNYAKDLLNYIEFPDNNGSSSNRRQTQMQYDTRGRLTSVLNQNGPSPTAVQARVTYGYDGFSRMTTLGRFQTAGSELDYLFGYDVLDRATSMKDPLSRTTTTTYQPYCKSYTQETPRQVIRNYNFDGLCQPTQVETFGEKDVIDTDELGRVRTVTQQASDFSEFGSAPFGQARFQNPAILQTKQISYDDLSRVTSVTYSNSPNAVLYSYYPEGEVNQMTDTNKQVTKYTYTPDHRPLTVQVSNGADNPTFTYSYDGLGRFKQIQYPTSTGITANFQDANNNTGWDANGRLTLLRYSKSSSSDLQSFAYGYDHSGNRTSCLDTPISPTSPNTWSYGYDYFDRLASATLNSNQTQYQYDLADNRTAKIMPGSLGTYNYAYDQADQLTTRNLNGGANDTFTHDPDGNLTSKVLSGVTTNYSWDDNNTLLSIYSSNALVESNTYDASGLRKTTTPAGGATVSDYNSGSTPLSDSGPATISYIQGHQILGYLKNGVPYYFLTDALSSVRQIVDSTGTSQASFVYDEFGNQIAGTSDPQGLGLLTYIGSAGVKSESQSSMLLMGHRFYEPQLGQFITHDPIGFAGGLNLYSYAGQNPTNYADPTGLKDILWEVQHNGGLVDPNRTGKGLGLLLGAGAAATVVVLAGSQPYAWATTYSRFGLAGLLAYHGQEVMDLASGTPCPSAGQGVPGIGGNAVPAQVFKAERARLLARGITIAYNASLGRNGSFQPLGMGRAEIEFGVKFFEGLLPSVYVFNHEVGHAEQFLETGFAAYKTLTPEQKENFVLNYLQNLPEGTLTPEELAHAARYAAGYRKGG
jgi:RHS repeat-associated protein